MSNQHSVTIDPRIEEQDAETIKSRKRIYNKFKGEMRILVASDPHFTSQYDPAIDAIMKAPGHFDLCVISGDSIDQYANSRYPYERYSDIEDEAKASVPFEAALKRKCSNNLVKFMGNHDERGSKLLTALAREYAKKVGRHAGKVEQISRDVMADIYERVPGSIVHYHWWIRIGNAFIAHPDKYCSERLKSVQGTVNYLLEGGHKPESCFIGHTHRFVPPTPIRGTWMCEMPALCKRMHYMNGSGAYGGACHTGYTVISLSRNGNIKQNETYCYFVEAL